MKKYKIEKPLIVIHVPRTAGTSIRAVFQNWFGDNFHRHYVDISSQALPPKINISNMHCKTRPLCIYGHFDTADGSGVEEYYPDATQFITFLRDPFELVVSNYFVFKKLALFIIKSRGLDVSKIEAKDIETYIMETRPNMLNQFPREVNHHNFKDICEQYFIEIGITEKLNESMRRIATKLGFDYPGDAAMVNEAIRDELVPHNIKEKFMEKNQLEYEVYNYCFQKFQYL